MNALRTYRETLEMKRIGFIAKENKSSDTQLKSRFKCQGKIKNSSFQNYKAPVKAVKTMRNDPFLEMYQTI